ncbi:MAG: hypothetical protein M3Z02_02720 [Actinomycetota bacterium]|nr:hypothetical protein [Actinomycetota bacterium]
MRLRRPGGLDLVFAAAIVVELAALATLRHVPTVDGPAHLAGARVLSEPGAALYRLYYRIDLFPSPNMLPTLVLAALVRLTTPTVADTLLHAGYVVLFPLGLRYAVIGVRREARWPAFLAFPLSFGYLFWYGFENYCYGVALALFTIGYALRRRHGWGARSAGGLAALFVLTYLSHLVPFALAALFVAVLAVADARAARPGVRRRAVLAAPGLALVPATALIVAFALRGGPTQGPAFGNPLRLLAGLLTLAIPTVSFSAVELVFAVLTALVLYVGGIRVVRRMGRRSLSGPAGALAAAAAAAAVVYMVSPQQFGLAYGLLHERISVFPVLFAALWLAAFPAGRRESALGAGVLLVAAAGLAVTRAPDVRRYERQMTEYASAAEVVAPGSTMVGLRLQLDTPRGGPVRQKMFDPLRHATSLVAAETAGVDVGHYEAEYSYFPTAFRPAADLRRRIDPDLTGLEQVPPRVTLPAPQASGHDRIDYVLVWGARQATPAVRDSPLTAALLARLDESYRLVATTAPEGLVDVYVHR